MSVPRGLMYRVSEAPRHNTLAYNYKKGVIWLDHNCATHTNTIYAQYGTMEYKAKSIHSAKCWISAQMRRNS